MVEIDIAEYNSCLGCKILQLISTMGDGRFDGAVAVDVLTLTDGNLEHISPLGGFVIDKIMVITNRKYARPLPPGPLKRTTGPLPGDWK